MSGRITTYQTDAARGSWFRPPTPRRRATGGVLLEYFGQQAAPCGRCDTCRAARSTAAEEEQSSADSGLPLAVRATVAHRKFGRGTVQRYDGAKGGAKVVVLFASVGSKSLVADFAQKRRLIRQVS